MKSPKTFKHRIAFGLIPLILGFGVYPLLIPGFIFSLLALLHSDSKIFLTKIRNALTQPDCLFFLVLVVLFLITYWGFYIPYRPETTKIPWAYFEVIFALSIISLLWVAIFNNAKEHIELIWYFCLGAFLLVLGTVGAGLALNPPPYFGNIIHIRYLPFGTHSFINTPGMANLLSLFPITFLAGLLLMPDQRPRRFWLIGIFGFALSFGAAIVLGQRTYFIVVFIVTPLTNGVFLLLIKSWRSGLALLLLLASYPILLKIDESLGTAHLHRVLLKIDQSLGTAFLYRHLNQNLFNDPRFQMLESWTNQLVTNPFYRASVGPAPWDIYPWFHNFFADIHRLSGFWALLAAVILVGYIFYTILRVVRIDKRMGLFLIAIAIPCFLIMNTSVVPEGERQPFLLLLVIGAIAQLTISREKNKLKMNSSTPSHETGQKRS